MVTINVFPPNASTAEPVQNGGGQPAGTNPGSAETAFSAPDPVFFEAGNSEASAPTLLPESFAELLASSESAPAPALNPFDTSSEAEFSQPLESFLQGDINTDGAPAPQLIPEGAAELPEPVEPKKKK